ncbi:hypothetical protein VKT23_018637 [Stygiomarasmius scandens]|uniref:Heterokaryon incompatibility domain-containing protein n=1 Tax=Marasmiellus scandens TaxID=2682957 RepID=A0ABR1INQ6_9AGAR
MRLLNTATLELEDFVIEDTIPPYAILSHTWYSPGQEILFEDVRTKCWYEMYDKAEEKPKGYSKVKNACELAQKRKFDYIWIDTCCINKESSAELSEAINSMYRYYRDSKVCYAYLVDVPSDVEEDPRSDGSRFRRSNWFKRGWTLQELLAPSSVVFISEDWTQIGTRASLQDVVNAVTLIPIPALLGASKMDSFSLAQRMSWAANRATTRREDIAYSLMGIFNVNMPLLYGEGGARAFIRLQEEIIRYSTDESIFAWRASRNSSLTRGLFAHSPSEFIDSGQVVPTFYRYLYRMTNYGLHIRLRLIPVRHYDHLRSRVAPFTEPKRLSDTFLAKLHCVVGNTLGVFLRHEGGQRYVRVGPQQLILMQHDYGETSNSDIYDVYVKLDLDLSTIQGLNRHAGIRRCFTFSGISIGDVVERYPISGAASHVEERSPHVCVGSRDVGSQNFALMKVKLPCWNEELVMVFGYNSSAVYEDSKLWCEIVIDHAGESLENVYGSFCEGGQRAHIRTRAQDRVTKILSPELSVTMMIQTTGVKNEYVTEIDSKPRKASMMAIYPVSFPYGFSFNFTKALSELFELDLYPKQNWMHRSDGPFLTLKGGDGGLMVFQNKLAENQTIFAVAIGVQHSQRWIGIFSLEESEVAGFVSKPCSEWRLKAESIAHLSSSAYYSSLAGYSIRASIVGDLRLDSLVSVKQMVEIIIN